MELAFYDQKTDEIFTLSKNPFIKNGEYECDFPRGEFNMTLTGNYENALKVKARFQGTEEERDLYTPESIIFLGEL